MSFGVEIPFVSLLGFELTHFENGESAIIYSPRPRTVNDGRFTVFKMGQLKTEQADKRNLNAKAHTKNLNRR